MTTPMNMFDHTPEQLQKTRLEILKINWSREEVV